MMVVLSQLGAAVGSIIPGVGNAVGAVAGGAIGVRCLLSVYIYVLKISILYIVKLLVISSFLLFFYYFNKVFNYLIHLLLLVANEPNIQAKP